ncbi:ATP-binding protein [Sphingomonas sp. G124]|uniref:ATP-binding protein n=1 Tax=Sphingomonas cremea TaxID=2904799 RepID=A0A9X1QN26_9SPHN|nr:ATP-binding protein [Sphingomonas cremea]MCF2514908.1 ATP-binding protein [Sphingomonas cremea]
MNKRESNSGPVNCRLKGRNAVLQAVGAARAFGEAQSLTHDNCARLCIVIEELVANLYEHGGLTDEDRVELSMARAPEGTRVTIVDPGHPFDPRSAIPRGERPEGGGGAGLDIVRSWARICDYSATPEGNRLELLLPDRCP